MANYNAGQFNTMSDKDYRPAMWHSFSGFQKLNWLVDTKRARDFSEAGKILNAAKKKSTRYKPAGVAIAKATRLPYKDD